MARGLPLPRTTPATSIMSLTATATPEQRSVGRARGRGQRLHHGGQRPAEPVEPLVRGQQVEVRDLAAALAPLDRPDQLGDLVHERAADRVEVVDLGRAVPHGEVAPDARPRLAARRVERDQPVQRTLEVARVEAVERLAGAPAPGPGPRGPGPASAGGSAGRPSASAMVRSETAVAKSIAPYASLLHR